LSNIYLLEVSFAMQFTQTI